MGTGMGAGFRENLYLTGILYIECRICDYRPTMLNTFIASAAIVCYILSGSIFGLRLFRGSFEKTLPRAAGIVFGLAGVLIHALLLYLILYSDHGINLGFFDAASLISGTILLLLMFSAITKPVENLGIILLPLAILCIVLEMLIPASHLLPANTPGGLQMHVLISILAYSMLTMASVQAVLLAVQDHHLHNRHPVGFIRSLPPLQTMEALLFEMIGLGFVLLSLALLSGFIYLEDMFAQRMVHKTVLSILAWLVFGGLLWGRLQVRLARPEGADLDPGGIRDSDAGLFWQQVCN